MKFYVVENRRTDVLELCERAARGAGVNLIVVNGTHSDRFEKFKSTYEHLSTNPRHFELICFRRYFLLDELLGEQAESFVLIDSDVLLFPGVDRHIAKLTRGVVFGGSIISDDLENSKQISPHVSYWTRKALSDFTSFLLLAYSSPAALNELRKISAEFAQRGERGGVSDMTLLYLWASNLNWTPLNVVYDGAVIDHNISISSNYRRDEFEVHLQAKRVQIRDGRRSFVKRNGQAVVVLAMHFQGKAKLYMAAVLNHAIFRAEILRAYVACGRKIKALSYKLAARLR